MLCILGETFSRHLGIFFSYFIAIPQKGSHQETICTKCRVQRQFAYNIEDKYIKSPADFFSVLKLKCVFRSMRTVHIWIVLRIRRIITLEPMSVDTITKTRLFKYIQKFHLKNLKISDKKTLIVFLFLLKT